MIHIKIIRYILFASFLGGFCGAFLGGCATTGTNSQTALNVIRTDYLIALNLSFIYTNLPPCPTATLCSDPVIVKKLQDAANAADIAFKVAQTTLTDPAFNAGNDTDKILVSTVNAVKAFSDIALALQVK